MKNVLFINHTNNIFGAENVLLQVIEHCFSGCKNNVYVLEPRYVKESPFKKYAQKIGCENIISLSYKNLGVSIIRSYFVLLYNVYTLIPLYFYVKKNKIDIIYSNTSTTCIGVMLAYLTRKPHIWHIHEAIDNIKGWSPAMSGLYEKLFSYSGNHIVFVSQTQCDKWKEQISTLEKTIVIYNPIKEYPKSSGKTTKTTIFGYIGSRDKNKNIPMLIDAFADVYLKDNNTSLLLSQSIGDSDEIVKQKIIYFHLEDIVTEKLISDANATDFYNMIDVVILPSQSESWGLVILEAINAGKATIVTQNSGLAEVLQNGVHTLFVNPNDRQSIVNAMMKMTDKNFREQIVLNGQDLVAQKNFNALFKQQMQILFS